MTISGIRLVNIELRKVPEQMITAGRNQSQPPLRFSVNMYGWAIPTQGKASSVAVIPRFDGLKKCRLAPLVPTRNRCFEPIATAAAKAIGSSRSLA